MLKFLYTANPKQIFETVFSPDNTVSNVIAAAAGVAIFTSIVWNDYGPDRYFIGMLALSVCIGVLALYAFATSLYYIAGKFGSVASYGDIYRVFALSEIPLAIHGIVFICLIMLVPSAENDLGAALYAAIFWFISLCVFSLLFIILLIVKLKRVTGLSLQKTIVTIILSPFPIALVLTILLTPALLVMYGAVYFAEIR